MNIKKQLKTIPKDALSETEKRELLTRIARKTAVTLQYRAVPSPYASFWAVSRNGSAKVCAAALAILLLCGGTAYASREALPGDLLYPVKVNVVERAARLASLSPESRARKESAAVERRIEEFEKLAEKGKLTEARTQAIEDNITQSFKSFDQNIGKLPSGRAGSEKRRLEVELKSKINKHADKIREIQNEALGPNKRALQSVLERGSFRGKGRDRGEENDDKTYEEDNGKNGRSIEGNGIPEKSLDGTFNDSRRDDDHL